MDQHPKDPDTAMFDGDDLVEPPRWPKVIGTVSIAWGAIGFGCGGCMLGMGLMMSSLVKSVEAQQGPMPDVMKPTLAQFIIGGVGLIVPVMLIIAGVMTVARKRAGGSLHLVYSVLSLISTIAYTAVSLPRQAEVAEWVRQNPTDPWAKQANPSIGWSIFAVVTLVSLAYPVFCLIWFGAVKRGAPMDIPREEIV